MKTTNIILNEVRELKDSTKIEYNGYTIVAHDCRSFMIHNKSGVTMAVAEESSLERAKAWIDNKNTEGTKLVNNSYWAEVAF